MKIVTVCGHGLGTGLLLKMTVEKALKELGVTALVEVSDYGSSQGIKADLFVVTSDMGQRFAERGHRFVTAKNVMDKDDVKSKIASALGIDVPSR